MNWKKSTGFVRGWKQWWKDDARYATSGAGRLHSSIKKTSANHLSFLCSVDCFVRKKIVKLYNNIIVGCTHGCDCINMDWDLISLCVRVGEEVEVRDTGTDLANRDNACSGQKEG